MRAISDTTVTSDQFREVIGRFASGVTVITTCRGDAHYGATASAVTSLSLEPPMLLICMNRSSLSGRAIAEEGRFAVNVLGEDHSDLAVRFASPVPNRFEGVRVAEGLDGVPLLADALATFECRVVENVVGGTHYVFLAEVQRAAGRAGAPLAYFRGQFGRIELAQDEAVAQELRERILHRHMPVEEPIDLDGIATAIQAPRGVVYHALAKFTGEGLVERRRDGCFVVPAVTFESLMESAQARVAIFAGAAVQAVAVASEAELVTVRELLDALRAAATPPFSFPAWYTARAALMDGLADLAGASALKAAFDRVDVPAQIFSLWSGATAPDEADLAEIRRGYTDLVSACEAGQLTRVPDIVRTLLCGYDRLYRHSLANSNAI